MPDQPDCTLLLSDSLLLRVLSLVPLPHQLVLSLVCKRWCRIQGLLLQSITLNDWSFLSSGRMFRRFPNLKQIDLSRTCVRTTMNSGVFISSLLSVHIDAVSIEDTPLLISGDDFIPRDMVDFGLGLISEHFPKLRRLSVVGPTEVGITDFFRGCDTLQELELHRCDDFSLKGIINGRNLRVVTLIGKVEGLYDSVISDLGLTIIANGCTQLVKLELCGCEGSYDGIKAIGQCCPKLEEICLRDHRMDGGWLSALSFCCYLRTLKFISCKSIDRSPGPEEHLGICPALQELRLEMCRLRCNSEGMMALFSICEGALKLVVKDCLGLEDEIFGYARILRRLRNVSVEGCSLLTTAGLESVVHGWCDLESLEVVSCNNVRDSEVSLKLSSLFSALKELRWRPDSKSLLSSGLSGTGIGYKGGRFFKG